MKNLLPYLKVITCKLKISAQQKGFTSLLTFLVIAATALPASALIAKTFNTPNLTQLTKTNSSPTTQRVADSICEWTTASGCNSDPECYWHHGRNKCQKQPEGAPCGAGYHCDPTESCVSGILCVPKFSVPIGGSCSNGNNSSTLNSDACVKGAVCTTVSFDDNRCVANDSSTETGTVIVNSKFYGQSNPEAKIRAYVCLYGPTAYGFKCNKLSDDLKSYEEFSSSFQVLLGESYSSCLAYDIMSRKEGTFLKHDGCGVPVGMCTNDFTQNNCTFKTSTSNTTISLLHKADQSYIDDAIKNVGSRCGNPTKTCNSQQTCIQTYSGSSEGTCLTKGSGSITVYCGMFDGTANNDACETGFCDSTTLRCSQSAGGVTACGSSGTKCCSTNPKCKDNLTCNSSNICISNNPATIATLTSPGDGFCAGSDRSNPKSSLPNNATPSCTINQTTATSSGDAYCRQHYSNNNLYWYKCSPANAAGGADAPLMPPGADSKQSTKSDICGSPTQGGVDVAQNKDGYLAPICISTPPTSSTYTTGLFNSAFATYSNVNPYTLGKYYDVFKCVTPGQYDFSPRPPTAGREGICNKPPWTPYSSANPPPAGTPTCSDPIKPYYNPDSGKCEPRPNACPNIGPNGGSNTCQASACAGAAPDVVPGISTAESNQACTAAFPGDGRNNCCLLPSASGSQTPPATTATITINANIIPNGYTYTEVGGYIFNLSAEGNVVLLGGNNTLTSQGNNKWTTTFSGLRKRKYAIFANVDSEVNPVNNTTVCTPPFKSYTLHNTNGTTQSMCEIDLGDTSVSQTFTLGLTKSSGANTPGGGAQPGTNTPAAPVPAPGTLGGTCSAAGSCGGSANNSCEYGWTNSTTFDTTAPNRYCCAFGERYCTITGACMSDRSKCAASAQSTNPGTTGGGTAGSNGTGNAFSGDHCYSGDNACAPGYYCQGYLLNSATAHCAPVSSGSTNTNPPTSTNTGNGTCQVSADCPAGQSCTAGACTPIVPAIAGCPGGPGTSYPASVCQASSTCPAGTHAGSVNNNAACGTNQFCCIDNNYSGSIASSDEKNNTCVSNSQCVKSKLGSACVYTNNPNVGVCK